MVLRYFEKGDLRKQQANTWEEKVKMIYGIACDTKDIHDAGIIHR